nr:MAG TPA: YycJ-like MBL-fold protein [Caudoviricetes sp.]
MKLKILGSSSKGNCYVLDSGGEALIIECGVSYLAIQKALGFSLQAVVGCILSHEHGDHAREVKKLLYSRIPVYTSAGTARALSIDVDPSLHAMSAGSVYHLGRFTVLPFNVQHDASEPLGFLISHPDMGTTLFATDTYYLRYRFEGLNNILIECNYRRDILKQNVERGLVSTIQRDRVLRSHMSYEQCIATMMHSDMRHVNNVVLIHLSDHNSHAEEFRAGVSEAIGKMVHIAKPGMEIPFNKTPF